MLHVLNVISNKNKRLFSGPIYTQLISKSYVRTRARCQAQHTNNRWVFLLPSNINMFLFYIKINVFLGTPGAGKSYLCERIASELKFEWLDCSKIAKEKNFVEEYDEEYDCPILDEEKV